MDDFRNHVWDKTSLNSDEAKTRTKVIDSFGSRHGKIGESISSIGTTAVSKSKLCYALATREHQYRTRAFQYLSLKLE